jgi:hypothetical protein
VVHAIADLIHELSQLDLSRESNYNDGLKRLHLLRSDDQIKVAKKVNKARQSSHRMSPLNGR